MLQKIAKTLIFMTFLLLIVFTIFLGVHLYKRYQNSRSSGNSSNSVVDEKRRQKQRKEKNEKKKLKTEEVLKIGIFLLDEGEKLISSAYLCSFDRPRKRLEFYFLEGNTLFELSKEAYEELKTKVPDIPQIIRLSHSYSYRKNLLGLQVATAFLSDALESDVEYFIGLEEEVSKKVFYFNNKRDSVFLKEFQNRLLDGSGMEEFLKDTYKSSRTNLSKEEILSLLKECGSLKADEIHFYKLPHVEKNRGIVLEKEEVLEFIYGEKEKTN